jgi:electron transport complex protein RnfC
MAAGLSVLKAFPVPEAYELPLAPGSTPRPGIKKGRLVSRGEILADPPAAGLPRTPAHLPGKIVKIGARSVSVEVDPDLGFAARAMGFASARPWEAQEALLDFGIAPPRPPRPGEPVFVSGFDPEPGVRLAEALFGDQRSTLEAGLKLAAALFPGKPILQVLPPGARPLSFPGSLTLHLRLSYPHTLPPFLKARVQKSKGFDHLASGVVGARLLWLLGTAWRSGAPPPARPLSVRGRPALLSPGLSAARIFTLLNITPREGSVVVAGGLARGVAVTSLGAPLAPEVEALNLASGAARAIKKCVRCGRCREACPLGLPADALGRAPQAEWLDVLARERGLARCPACGLCAAACPSGLPLSALRPQAALWGGSRDARAEG